MLLNPFKSFFYCLILKGVILFTFINCDEIPALVTSIIIGIGIVFCGVASVQNVYLWQVSFNHIHVIKLTPLMLLPP